MELVPNSSFGSSHSGWVTKQSRTLKRWRRRWMVLDSRAVSTYKQQQQLRRPTEDLSVNDFRAITSVDEDPAHPYLFRLEVRGGVFLFFVDSQEVWEWWVGAIGKVMTNPAFFRAKGDVLMNESK